MGQQASGSSPPGLPGAQQQGGGSLPTNTHLNGPTCKVNHPCGIHTCPNYAKTKLTIKENQEKFQYKKPEEQLLKGDVVPAFVAVDGNTAPLKDTQQLGKELFESFSKNPADIWIAKTATGVEIEELSNSPPPLMSSDSESDWNTRQCALLHLLAWMLATALHLLNTACIEIVNWDPVRHLLPVFTVLLLVTASIGPTSVVWVAEGALLASCKHHGSITRKEINSMYFQSAPAAQEKIQKCKLIYKLKQSRERFRYKASRSVPVFSATCRISTLILMSVNSSAEAVSRTYIDSGCAITIINYSKLLHNICHIKPIVVQGETGEQRTHH
eukprot:2377493-Rhodomonas_salina.2